MVRTLIRKLMPGFIADLHKEGLDEWLIRMYYHREAKVVHILELDDGVHEFDIIFKEEYAKKET